jgi:antitoxin FitA
MIFPRFHNTTIFMPTLTLKGLPDALYERLKLQAAANRRSLNSEVLVCLEQAVASQGISTSSMLARIERMQEQLNVQPFNDLELQAAKEHGRP